MPSENKSLLSKIYCMHQRVNLSLPPRNNYEYKYKFPSNGTRVPIAIFSAWTAIIATVDLPPLILPGGRFVCNRLQNVTVLFGRGFDGMTCVAHRGSCALSNFGLRDRWKTGFTLYRLMVTSYGTA